MPTPAANGAADTASQGNLDSQMQEMMARLQNLQNNQS
tara:strand:+ start:95 stop:208 length:114 start_codon:yes stop_codon:yes gene_type:complete